MRRALLLGLALLAPALGARAQTITFTPDAIGKSGCAPSTKTVTLNVTPTFGNTGASLANGGTFKVVASKSATTTNSTTGLPICASDALPVGGDVTATTSSFPRNAADILTAAGITCNETSDVTINVCVLFIQTGSGATITNPSGSATGAITFSVVQPDKPVITSVEPGESALVVSWGAAANASYYVITAVNAADASDIHYTKQLTSTSKQTIAGLTNGVTYNVTVTAFSAADTASVPSDPAQGIPTPVDDFWERYHNAGGQEQGGCASGPAGLLGMLLAAAGLSRLRRRS